MLAVITAVSLTLSIVVGIALLVAMIVRDEPFYGALSIMILGSLTSALTFAHLAVTGY